MLNFLKRNSSVINVSAQEAHDIITKSKDILILDVRTPGEFSNGHIPGAINIPHNILPVRLNELDKFKDKTIIVHCEAGGRSASAVRILEQNGFKNIYHMYKGFSSWKYEVAR